jgi:hypothetical protein
MAKVVLSKKLRGILKDRVAREQLSDALDLGTRASQQARKPATVTYEGKKYNVLIGATAEAVGAK